MIIVHRCSCGHPDIFHRHPEAITNQTMCSNGSCPANTHELGMPELIPTFVDGQVNEFVHKPGSSTSGLKLCDCADCRALYAEVRNDVEPLKPWYSREASGVDT